MNKSFDHFSFWCTRGLGFILAFHLQAHWDDFVLSVRLGYWDMGASWVRNPEQWDF